MEQKKYNDPVKSPIIQEIIMSNRIGAISIELAKRLNIEPVKALQRSPRHLSEAEVPIIED